MTNRFLNTLAIVGAALQATIAFGFLGALTVIGLTAFGFIPAPI